MLHRHTYLRAECIGKTNDCLLPHHHDGDGKQGNQHYQDCTAHKETLHFGEIGIIFFPHIIL